MINFRNKLKTVYKISENNKNIINTNIFYINNYPNQVSFNKKTHTVILLDRTLYTNPVEIEYNLPLLTEQFLSNIKIVLIVESEDPEIFTASNSLYSPIFRYIWRKNSDGYTLQAYYSGTIAQLTGHIYTNRPLYLNLFLKIYNERIWNVIQNSKT